MLLAVRRLLIIVQITLPPSSSFSRLSFCKMAFCTATKLASDTSSESSTWIFTAADMPFSRVTDTLASPGYSALTRQTSPLMPASATAPPPDSQIRSPV